MVSNVIPNFFIAGAAKSATTSIFHYLKKHPDVFFPIVKEPKYFSAKYIDFPQLGNGDQEFTDKWVYKDLDRYLDLYKNADGYKIIGDASVDNLYYYSTANDIKEFNPDTKVLVILRNPIDRAFSHYTHFIRDNRETETFERAILLEEKRRSSGFEFSWFYKHVGLYYEQVKNYKLVFGENLKVIIFEEFEAEPQKHMKDICGFLEIDNEPISKIAYIKHNSSGSSKSAVFSKVVNGHFPFKTKLKNILPFSLRANIKALFNIHNNVKMMMNPETRKGLSIYFKSDIENLEKLLGRELKIWE